MQQWPADRTIILLAAATAVAQAWDARRESDCQEFASLIEDLLFAIDETIQVWQDYQYTEASHPLHGDGHHIADWVGTARRDRLAELNWRMNDTVQAAAELTGLDPGEARDNDHVMLKVACGQFDAEVSDPGAYAARVAIQYLTQYATQVKLLQERLT